MTYHELILPEKPDQNNLQGLWYTWGEEDSHMAAREHSFSFAWTGDHFEVTIDPQDLPGLEVKATGGTWREALHAAEDVLGRAMFRADQAAAAAPARRRAAGTPTRPTHQRTHQATP
jgi:hypothetical protein